MDLPDRLEAAAQARFGGEVDVQTIGGGRRMRRSAPVESDDGEPLAQPFGHRIPEVATAARDENRSGPVHQLPPIAHYGKKCFIYFPTEGRISRARQNCADLSLTLDDVMWVGTNGDSGDHGAGQQSCARPAWPRAADYAQ